MSSLADKVRAHLNHFFQAKHRESDSEHVALASVCRWLQDEIDELQAQSCLLDRLEAVAHKWEKAAADAMVRAPELDEVATAVRGCAADLREAIGRPKR